MPPAGLAATARCPGGYGIRPYAVGIDACIDSEPRRLPHVAFLGPLCEGAPPAGGGGENLFPGDYDDIRQGRGHNVCLAVSRDGAEQAVDVCFDLTRATSRWPLTAG